MPASHRKWFGYLKSQKWLQNIGDLIGMGSRVGNPRMIPIVPMERASNYIEVWP